MRCRPLPVAPRPYPGEAISSWVCRIAARYDLGADDLVAHILGYHPFGFGSTERLDYRTDALLENALAAATRVEAATIKRLRVVCEDGRAAGWHRTSPAWCPICIRGDLEERGELYERAIWRLGACVICPNHDVPLVDTCRWCVTASCRFLCGNGRLRLACTACGHPVDPPPGSGEGADDRSLGAFGLSQVVSVRRVVSDLQDDLQAALLASPPRRNWGPVRFANGLISAVRDLSLCMIVAMRLKVEPQVELPEPKPREPYSPIYHPITPAGLRSRLAFDVLAYVAGVLRTLGRGGDAHQQWRPDAGTDLMSAASFLAWLPVRLRRLLAGAAIGWEQPAGDALRATIARFLAVA
jgi:TniQ